MFNLINAAFDFTIDVCASRENAKLDRYFSEEEDGLEQPWKCERCWCNPPYGAESISAWLRKAEREANESTMTVLLLPAAMESSWMHQIVLPHRRPFLPWPKRIAFLDPTPSGRSGPTGGSILVFVGYPNASLPRIGGAPWVGAI